MAEDGQEIQHLFGSPSGDETFPVARNDFNDKEFTGPVYSPDHQIRFAKLQIPGTMFAIIGPWRDQG